MIKTYFNKIRKLDVNTLEVFKKSFFSILVKVIGMAFAFAISVFLGRAIGPAGLGVINLANQIVMVLLVLTMFGMQHVLVKNTAIGYRQKSYQLIANNVKTAIRFNGFISFTVMLIMIVLAYNFSEMVFEDADLKLPLIIVLVALVPQTFSRVYAAAMNGLRKVWQSNLFEQVLTSIFVAIGLFVSYVIKWPITVKNVAILYVISRLIVFVIAKLYWNSIFKNPDGATFSLKPMIKMALPLLLVSSTSVLATNADTIMLGIMDSSESVGLYSVASRIAMMTSFMLLVSNTAISPKLAYMYSEGDIQGMQKMVRQTTLGVILVAGALLLVFLLMGKSILTLWGDAFSESYVPLMILCSGQFLNVATGCSGMLLIMCGHEKIHRNISLVSLTTNILLNFFLIINFGIVGAAVATALTVGLENILKVIYAKKKVGILPTPF